MLAPLAFILARVFSPTAHTRRLVIAPLVGVSLTLGACHQDLSLNPHTISQPELKIIYAKFANTVNAAKNDPKTEWHSSWHGNFVVNTFGGDHKGLCWEWRNLVYDAVAPTARRVGWDACGVNINYGTVFEHHAVLVWDPKKVKFSELLTQPTPRHGYVLDGWTRGEPDIFLLDMWFEAQTFHLVDPDTRDMSDRDAALKEAESK